MISEIASQLVQSLSTSVPFADKIAGLVMPMKKSVNKIEKVLPVAINTKTVCNVSDYMDLVPDSTKKSIMYCEKLGDIQFDMYRPSYWICSADLRLVCWYNLNLINETLWVDEGIVIANVLSQLPVRMDDALFTYVKKVIVTVTGVVTGSEIFSRYTYDEVRTQFMTFPYGAFAIDLNVQYVLNKCAETLTPAPGCGFGGAAPLPDPVDYITITKVVTGDANNEEYFDITITGAEWEQSGQVRVGEPLTFENLPDDTYVITETLPSGYELVSISEDTISIPTVTPNVTITNQIAT